MHRMYLCALILGCALLSAESVHSREWRPLAMAFVFAALLATELSPAPPASRKEG